MDEKNQSITIVIIDKHALFRAGIRQLLEPEGNLKVVAEGVTIQDAELFVNVYHPNILLIDYESITTEELSEYTESSKGNYHTKIIILSEKGNDNFIIDSLQMGVRGYVIKEMDSETFIHVIKEVHKGKVWFHPYIINQMIKQSFPFIQLKESSYSDEQRRKALCLFTSREYDVLQLLGKGCSTKSIAEKLNVSTYTVSSHIRNILKKSHANDRTHAVVIAVENGWIQIPQKVE